MDNFYEHLYKYKKKPSDYFIQVLIFLATMGVAVTCYFFFAIFLPNIKLYPVFLGRIIGILTIVGAVYFGYKFFMRFDIEYEYTYMTGEIDFDKILSKSTRTRILTAKCETFEEFGEYNNEVREKLKNREFNKLFDFSSNTDAKRYYAVLNHKTFKKTVVIFEPTEEMVTDMKRFMKNVPSVPSWKK